MRRKQVAHLQHPGPAARRAHKAAAPARASGSLAVFPGRARGRLKCTIPQPQAQPWPCGGHTPLAGGLAPCESVLGSPRSPPMWR